MSSESEAGMPTVLVKDMNNVMFVTVQVILLNENNEDKA